MKLWRDRNADRIDVGQRLEQLRWTWERSDYDRLVAENRARLGAARPPKLDDVLLWLNENEPTMLREALDEAGVP
ncbi:hypothetical protein GCM10027053_51630 [Intrasporangium mesophilum]